MREEKSKKTGLAKASVYVYSLLLVLFIVVQIYFEVKRGNFWSSHLNTAPDVMVSEFHEVQVQYCTCIGIIVGLTILWAVTVNVSKKIKGTA